MNKKNIILAFVVVLAACAAQRPDVGPWGYEFALGDFEDVRAADDYRLMSELDFSTDKFMRLWREHTARDLFAHQPALLDVTLKHFEATRSQWSYALTMGMDLRGRDARTGRVIAERSASCNVVTSTNVAGLMGESVQQAWDKGDAGALTRDGRTQTMWQKVWDKCVYEIIQQFDQAVLAAH